MTQKRATIIASLCLAAVVAAFWLIPATRDELCWQWASARDRTDNYSGYLANWPRGRHVAEAIRLYDERGWSDVQAAPSRYAYLQYLAKHPAGSHSPEAKTGANDPAWNESRETTLTKRDADGLAVYPTQLIDHPLQAVSTTTPAVALARNPLSALSLPPATPLTRPVHFAETIISSYRKNTPGAFTTHWVAYILNAEGSTKENPKVNVQLNGRLLGPYENISRMFASSRDGQHIAFVAKRADRWHIIVDGVEKWSHHDLLWATSTWTSDLEGTSVAMQVPAAPLVFSADGATLAYTARTASGSCAVMIDGTPGPEFPRIGSDVTFVGNTVTYAAWLTPNKTVRVYGSKVLGPYDSATSASFSTDGQHMAMAALSGNKHVLVVDGIEREAPGPVTQVEVATNGQVAFCYKAGDKMRLRFGDAELPGDFDEIVRLVISPDSKKVAYWARDGVNWTVRAGNHDYAGFDGDYYYVCGNDVYSIMWSADSDHIAYYCRDKGSSALSLDGRKIPENFSPKGFAYTVFVDDAHNVVGVGLLQAHQFDRQAFVQAILSKDKITCDPLSATLLNGKLCYIDDRNDSTYLNIGVLKQGPYEGIASPLLLSPKSDHYAFIIKTDKGQQIVIDQNAPGDPYDAIYRPAFSESGDRLTFLAVRDGNLLSVEQPTAVLSSDQLGEPSSVHSD
jgi:hypothetical protein